jgi:hypothetical protein
MKARLFEEQLTLSPGLVVRVQGERGLFRAVEEAASGSGCWWFLPCLPDGTWTRMSGFRAFRPERCRPKRPR